MQYLYIKYIQVLVRLIADYRIKLHAPLIKLAEPPNFLNFNLAIVLFRRNLLKFSSTTQILNDDLMFIVYGKDYQGI